MRFIVQSVRAHWGYTKISHIAMNARCIFSHSYNATTIPMPRMPCNSFSRCETEHPRASEAQHRHKPFAGSHPNPTQYPPIPSANAIIPTYCQRMRIPVRPPHPCRPNTHSKITQTARTQPPPARTPLQQRKNRRDLLQSQYSLAHRDPNQRQTHRKSHKHTRGKNPTPQKSSTGSLRICGKTTHPQRPAKCFRSSDARLRRSKPLWTNSPLPAKSSNFDRGSGRCQTQTFTSQTSDATKPHTNRSQRGGESSDSRDRLKADSIRMLNTTRLHLFYVFYVFSVGIRAEHSPNFTANVPLLSRNRFKS